MPAFRIITRTVWVLSLVSLLTDMASEMLYPVMPFYLESIGFSIVLIGVLEGFAEAMAGLSKGYFGKLSDHKGKRVPFVQIGYAFSALSKPLMAVAVFPLWVFFARTLDRLGKGIRTGARDALLSDEATPATKARVFGFHRSMDTVGAVAGPALALVYLYFYPEQYRTLFFLAFIPGVLAIVLTYLLKEKPAPAMGKQQSVSFLYFFRYWNEAPVAYRQLIVGLLLFALINSSDVFLLLRVRQAGLSDVQAIGAYIFYNLIYALAAYPFGIWADRIGVKRVFLIGLLLFCIVYAGMIVVNTLTGFIVLFFLYGLFAAATEGVAKAWISNITSATETATAIGTYTGFQSICALLASSLTGWIWFQFGTGMAFGITAVTTLLLLLYFSWVVKAPENS